MSDACSNPYHVAPQLPESLQAHQIRECVDRAFDRAVETNGKLSRHTLALELIKQVKSVPLEVESKPNVKTFGEHEPFKDQLSRVGMMATGDPTWDLSDSDIAALDAVLSNRRRVFIIMTEVADQLSSDAKKYSAESERGWEMGDGDPRICRLYGQSLASDWAAMKIRKALLEDEGISK